MGFTPRTTRPGANNKYYITKSKGGYSSAIQGKCGSTGKPDAQNDVLANCVGYAYGRFNEIGGYKSCKYLVPTNAENFPEHAGDCKTGSTPKLGAVIVWKKGNSLGGSDGAGHVAIVERINADGSILISQSGYNSQPFWTETIKKGDGNWRCSWMGSAYTFRCFIYNPAVKEEVATKKTTTNTKKATTKSGANVVLKKGNKGSAVKTLQSNLNKLGYSLKVDGDFGDATEKAVKSFQKKHNLTVDGIVGTKTQNAIKTALSKKK